MKASLTLSLIFIAAATAFYAPPTDPSAELQLIINGIFEQASLADPTTVLACFTGDTPQQTIDFLGNLTDSLANSQYLKIASIVFTYRKNLPDSVNQCVSANAEVEQAKNAYGTGNLTVLGLIQKVERYVIANSQNIHSDFVELDTQFNGGSYDAYGRDAGGLLQSVMTQEESWLDKRRFD